jgi:pimeloyl-ACP methyl ester carboxylesterase
VQCTRTGQVALDYANAKSGMDLIRDFYQERRGKTAIDLKHLYSSQPYPGINSWRVSQYEGTAAPPGEILWQAMGTSKFQDSVIDRYLLRHSQYLEIPLVYIHKAAANRRILLWLGENGKLTAQNWPAVSKYLDAGYDIVSLDPRGLGETRMRYTAASPDDPTLAQNDGDSAYSSPLLSVLADYVYNSLLTGRPYFLQMIEDVEIAIRFVQERTNQSEFTVLGSGSASTWASAVAEILPPIKLISPPDTPPLKWSSVVNEKLELWPVQYLLPEGAYVH